MHALLTLATASTYAALAALHFFWAAGGRLGVGAAVPSTGGVPAFSPGPLATLAVAFALVGAALLVASAGGRLSLPFPRRLIDGLALLLAFVMIARAIGDFRLLGFFKTRGDGAFATLDTFVYSPLCLLLGAAILLILWTRPVPGA